MKEILMVFLVILFFTSCTYSIIMVHTEGPTSDVVDETATNTPNTSISPNLNLPIKPL